MEELIKRLQDFAAGTERDEDAELAFAAIDAIDRLVNENTGLRIFFDSIIALPDCNTCMKKDYCDFVPRVGQNARINCAFYLGDLKEEKQ